MKIVIKINKNLYKNKEELKRMIDREDFNDRIKTAIDNGKGLAIVTPKGETCYSIIIRKENK